MRNSIVRYILANQFLIGIFVIALGWFILENRNIFVILFISYIIMAALSPAVTFLKKQGIPKPFTVIIPYAATLGLILLLIISLVPFLFMQVQSLFTKFPFYVNQAVKVIGVEISLEQIQNMLSSEVGAIGANAIALTGKVFGGFFSILTILVISFYLLMDQDGVRENLVSLFPKNSHNSIHTALNQIEQKLGGWLRGQILLSVSMGLLIWITLTLLGLEFALPLAVIAGFLEIIPTIGPIVAAIPAVTVALSVSPTMAIIVVVSYTIIQWIEAHILVPQIMKKAVGLNPVVIITGIILGNQMMGVIGALLSIPFISLLVIVFRLMNRHEQ